MAFLLKEKQMDDDTFKEVEDYMQSLLREMDTPKVRINNKDWNWVNRNLYIKNSDHVLFDEVMILLQKVLKHKARNPK